MDEKTLLGEGGNEKDLIEEGTLHGIASEGTSDGNLPCDGTSDRYSQVEGTLNSTTRLIENKSIHSSQKSQSSTPHSVGHHQSTHSQPHSPHSHSHSHQTRLSMHEGYLSSTTSRERIAGHPRGLTDTTLVDDTRPRKSTESGRSWWSIANDKKRKNLAQLDQDWLGKKIVGWFKGRKKTSHAYQYQSEFPRPISVFESPGALTPPESNPPRLSLHTLHSFFEDAHFTEGGVGPKLRAHGGAIDHAAVTSKAPSIVLLEIESILTSNGLEHWRVNENGFRIKVVRRSLRKVQMDGGSPPRKGRWVEWIGRVGHQVWKKGVDLLPKDSPNSESSSLTISPILDSEEPGGGDSCFGLDSGSEVRFVIEICQLKHLPGLYYLDFLRTRGDIWDYEKLYKHIMTELPLNHGDYLL